MTDKISIKSEPSQSSGRWLTWKVLTWLVVWGTISILLFLILSFVWWVFTSASTQTSEFVNNNPILPFIVLLIWFLSSFIWNLAIAWIYSLFFSERYFNITKTIWILLLTNWILFIFFVPVYFMFGWDTNTLFLILWFYIMFSIFLSAQQIETVSNPNYSASSLIWATLWFVITILVYSLIRKWSGMWWTQNQVYLLLLLPTIIWFGIMPIGLWVREKIYYKMYEIWNNWFYTPPHREEYMRWKDTNSDSFIDEHDDINIDLQ